MSSLIIDEDGVYDPKLINDRLLLGMKGTFSELELSILRQRSQEALRLKAARGDLHTSVAIGRTTVILLTPKRFDASCRISSPRSARSPSRYKAIL